MGGLSRGFADICAGRFGLSLCVTQAHRFNARCVRKRKSLRYCHDVRPSVCLSGTGVHCDQAVQISADLSLCLDSPMFWAP